MPPTKQMIVQLIEDSRLIRRRCFRKARNRFHVSCDFKAGVAEVAAVAFVAVVVEVKRERGRVFSGIIRI